MDLERVIGEYTGTKEGPLLICLGGIHGNEHAGIEALEEVFKLLDKEPERNSGFVFNGKMVGLRGNLTALKKGVRFIHHDMNRLWTKPNVTRLQNSNNDQLTNEEQELKALHAEILSQIERYPTHQVVLMDLHTTTAFGGIFTISTDDPESFRIATELHAPVIQGMLKNISGTTMHYFSKENFDLNLVAVCFESGQHDDPESKLNAVSAIINCLRTIGCVDGDDVENKHDDLLQQKAGDLPTVTELIYCHSVKDSDEFKMRPGYQNFQPVKKGELLATDRKGEIYSHEDGLILMPLYQSKGEDGFFLIKVSEGY